MFDINTTNPPLIDIHSHRQDADSGLSILSLDTHEWVKDGRVGLSDSTAHDNSALVPAYGYFSLGLHPWFIEGQDIATAMQLLDSIGHDPNLLAIGECGLDKCIDTPMMVQIEIFTRQIELAEHLGKPLMIHCVKAFNELMQINKSRRAGSVWIIHGFNANPVLAAQLLKHGCYLSFGAALLNPRSHAGQALVETPLNRLFLETDTADVPIGAIYAAAAKMLRIDVETLRQQILNNFNRVFLND